MFKNRWWMGTRVTSDEGFSIEWMQALLIYREGKRCMSVTVDYGANNISIFADTATRWDDDPATLIDKDTQERIIGNIVAALNYYQNPRGGKVRVVNG